MATFTRLQFCLAAGRRMTVIALCVMCVFIQFTLTYGHSSESFCPFFNNRGPSEQLGLQNCTWFKKKSCCMQQEIEATFGSVKPFQGASLSCQRHTNYLMCYICAPNQNIFYKKERLTVCEEFCDALFQACKNAILKGSVIQDLYPNGKAFCESRSYQVESEKNRANKRYKLCFDFDMSLDISGSPGYVPNWMLILCAVSMSVMSYTSIIALISRQLITDPYSVEETTTVRSGLCYPGSRINTYQYRRLDRSRCMKSINLQSSSEAEISECVPDCVASLSSVPNKPDPVNCYSTGESWKASN